MNDMINDEDDYTQAEGYDIDAEQLFLPNGMPTQEGMTTAALAATLVGVLSRNQEDQPKDGELHIGRGQGPLRSLVGDINRSHLRCRAKGIQLLEKVGKFFHERRKICEKPFQSDRNDLSLSKRWGTIHAGCSKFQGSFEKIQKRQISGIASVDLVKHFLFLSLI
jgi:hypothetical protein